MPTYTFRNRETQEEKTEIMSIASMEAYLKDNPEWQIMIMPLQGKARDNFVASRHTNIPIDGDFRDMLKNMQKANPGSTIEY